MKQLKNLSLISLAIALGGLRKPPQKPLFTAWNRRLRFSIRS